MDPTIEELQRSVRRLRIGLAIGGIAIVALAVAHVIASRPPSELSIGDVTIDDRGITIDEGRGHGGLALRSGMVHLWDPHHGGVRLIAGEAVVSDEDELNFVRIQAYGSDEGAATFEVGSRSERFGDSVSAFRVGTFRSVAVTRLFGPGGETMVETPRAHSE